MDGSTAIRAAEQVEGVEATSNVVVDGQLTSKLRSFTCLEHFFPPIAFAPLAAD
jgi:hypothetical protein